MEKKPRTEIRRPVEVQPIPETKPVEPETPVEGGVEGGVIGGMVGGVVGGVVGGTVGGTGSGEPVKPMNVPPFFIQRDVVRQTSPRLSAVFKQTHLEQTMQGIFKVCVATKGPGVLPLQPPHHHPVSAAARGGGPLR